MELANCRRCGKLFRSVGVRICPDCLELEEEEFQKVKAYLREHPEARILEVSEATGVSAAQILEFVRRGKLIAHSPDSDLAVECTVCGTRIVSGRLCRRCQADLSARQQGDPEQRLVGKVYLRDRLRRSDGN